MAAFHSIKKKKTISEGLLILDSLDRRTKVNIAAGFQTVGVVERKKKMNGIDTHGLTRVGWKGLWLHFVMHFLP